MSHEKPPEQRNIDWGKVIEEALTAPGDLCGIYDRFHDYSLLNKLLLMMQGTVEPVASYKRWSDLGRQVLKGAQAKEIIVPLIVRRENDKGEKEEIVTGFKGLRCIFGLSDTTGEELPPFTVPEWDLGVAFERMGIRKVPFRDLNGNKQGYARGKDIAINPVAKYPMKTTFHEIAHIALGHTLPDRVGEYEQHRGVMEFEAEGTSYLVMKELKVMDEAQASVSRAYIQDWLGSERPPDSSIRSVFRAVDTVLKAGRLAISPPEEV